MSKVTMPAPVACLWIKNGVVVNAFSRPPCLHDGDHRNEYFIKKGFTEEPLITTTQAEAYSDARVREQLEIALAEAKRVSDKYGYGYYGSEVDAVDEVAEAIRALIPPLPGPVEP